MTYLNSYHEQQHKNASKHILSQPKVTSAQALKQLKDGRKKDLEETKKRHSAMRKIVCSLKKKDRSIL